MLARTVRPRRPIAWAALLVGAACTDAPSAPSLAPRDAPSANATADYAQTSGFRRAVTLAAVREHQAAFQSHADLNGGMRATGTPGFAASAAYVAARLTAAGYAVTWHSFTFPFVAERTPSVLAVVSPDSRQFVAGTDFAPLAGSANGDVTAPVYAVQLSFSPATGALGSGCEAADFAGMPAGVIALLQRGVCNFDLKALNAQAAGAVGVVILNEGNTSDRLGVFNGTLGGAPIAIPVVGTSFAVGQSLAVPVQDGLTGTVARLRLDILSETRTGHNVIAEAPGGDANNVILVASVLDGGAQGPAINATSGAASALAIAQALAAQDRTPTNRLRFAFFGGYFEGRLGTQHYLDALVPADRARIRAVVGSEVLGSPNFGRFVLDGTGAPAGSGAIRDLLLEYFGQAGLRSQEWAPSPAPFAGSVLGPFAALGIPVGGVYAGTSEPKTPEQQALFGGTVGIAFDPCYRQTCDTFASPSLEGLDQLTDATAHLTLLLSRRNLTREPLAAP